MTEFIITRDCFSCDNGIRYHSTGTNGNLDPLPPTEYPCEECVDGYVELGRVTIPQFDDILDKCNDILNKCNDILEQMS